MSQSSLSPAELESAIHMLHRAGQCADDLFSAGVEHAQLTPRQYIVLRCAASSEGASQTDLVDATGIDRSTLADIVRRLVERGYLGRERKRRASGLYGVQVRRESVEVLASTQPITESCERQLLDAVAPGDREAFLRSLRSIVTTFGPISSARVASKTAQPSGDDASGPDEIKARPATASANLNV
ncbi:MAG: MarR family transcriptional regulator [Hyphomicrobiaceae bacterium]|nr:MarR family transcriptional regulator [Hyphomicrobiaceae bacterium]